jgi:DNA repair exonuclease SbcCD nuclease subunit
LKILHIADEHANCNFADYLKSLTQIKEYITKNPVDLIVSAGDLFDSRDFLDTTSTQILLSFAELSNYAPIFMVYGTPSHDHWGSLDLLPKLAGKYPIKVIDKVDNNFYHFSGKDSVEVFRENYIANYGFYLFGVPWLMRSRVLDQEELKLPIKQQEELFMSKMKAWVKFHKELKTDLLHPTIMVAHLQLKDAVFSKGQDISSEYHDPEWFYDTCDYGALGHVHSAQNFKNLYYAGSIYNKSWGEMEKKFFNVITIENNKITNIEKVKFDTPLLVKATLNSVEEYEEFKQDWENNNFETEDKKVRLWIQLTVKSKEAFGDDLNYWKKFSNLEELRFGVSELKGETVIREIDIKPNATLVEKAVGWAETKGLQVTEFQKNKLVELENGN